MLSTTTEFDPLREDTLRDPYPEYREMQAHRRPLWSDRLNSWVVTTYDECKHVLSDYSLFTADFRKAGEQVPDRSLNVHTLDPPHHSLIYRNLAVALRDASEGDLNQRTRDFLTSRWDSLRGTTVNLVQALSEPAACWFLATALQIPALDTPEMLRIGDRIHRAMDAGLVPSAVAPGREAHHALADLIKGWSEHGSSDNNLIRRVMDRSRELGVAEDLTLNSVRTLVANAYTSLPSAVSTILLMAGRRPDLLAGAATPSDASRLCHELLRYESPSQGTTRLCAADTELAGVPIKRGEAVLALVGAANRDPRKFHDPDTVRVDRSPNSHLAFGAGPHTCAAAALSMCLLKEVVLSVPRMNISLRQTGQPRQKNTATIRMLADLTVEVQPLC